MKMKRRFLNLILCWFMEIFIIISTSANNCYSPDHQQGECKEITKCTSLYNFLNVNNSKNATCLEYLRRSHCGFLGETPKVCCPKKNPIVDIKLIERNNMNEFDDECFTPEQNEGVCKLITDCAPLYKLLINLSYTKNSSIVEYLRKSHCGFSGTIPEVCCPIGENDGNLESEENLYISKNLNTSNNVHCGIFNENKIFNGNNVEVDQYPWTALLKYQRANGHNEFYCGGTLISDRYVLTAAHCVKGKKLPKNAKLVSVRLGEHNIDTNPDCDKFDKEECADPYLDVPIEEIISHELYNPNDPHHYHDIALIRLNAKVHFNDFILPACLPPIELNKNYTGQNLATVGWGIDNNKMKTKIRKKDSVIGFDTASCNVIFNSIGVHVGPMQFCTVRGKWEMNCAADSGGAVLDFSHEMFGFYTAGVVSFEDSPCNLKNQLRVYTRVDQYIDWLSSNMKA